MGPGSRGAVVTPPALASPPQPGTASCSDLNSSESSETTLTSIWTQKQVKSLLLFSRGLPAACLCATNQHLLGA